MVRLFVLLLLCSCATAPVIPPGQLCEHDYEQCNNRCFASPNYRRNGPQCLKTQTWQVCPQETQILDTIAAGKCFDACEWDHKLCNHS